MFLGNIFIRFNVHSLKLHFANYEIELKSAKICMNVGTRFYNLKRAKKHASTLRILGRGCVAGYLIPMLFPQIETETINITVNWLVRLMSNYPTHPSDLTRRKSDSTTKSKITDTI